MSIPTTIYIDLDSMNTKTLEKIRSGIDQLISDRRQKIPSVSYLNTMKQNDRCINFLYNFTRKKINGVKYWICNLKYSRIYDHTLCTWGMDLRKKKAKEFAASEMRLFFDKNYQPQNYERVFDENSIGDFGIEKVSDELYCNCIVCKRSDYDHVDIDDFDNDDENVGEDDSESDDELYCDCSLCVDYDHSDNSEPEGDSEPTHPDGDSEQNPEWMPEWPTMTNEEKKEFLNNEIETYTDERDSKSVKKSVSPVDDDWETEIDSSTTTE